MEGSKLAPSVSTSVLKQGSTVLRRQSVKGIKNESSRALLASTSKSKLNLFPQAVETSKRKKVFHASIKQGITESVNAARASVSTSKTHQVLSLKTEDLWSKVRSAVKIAGAIGRLNKETENARKQRIKRHWDLVRQISRAAISLAVISDKRDQADSKMGIKNYTRFIEILSTHPSKRTNPDLRFLMTSTKHLAFFSNSRRNLKENDNKKTSLNQSETMEISEHQHFELCRTMTLRRFENSHEYVFRQGDTGEEFFIILEGSVAVQRRTGKVGIDRTVARMEAGASFGELALTGTSTGAMRTASIITIEPSTCLVIHKNDYRRILSESLQEVLEQKMKFLRKVHALQDLSDRDIFNIGICLQLQKVRVGTTIIKEGSMIDPLRFFIVVKRGELEVRKRVSVEKKDTDGAKTNTGKFHQLSLCLMGPTESVCDYRLLTRKESPGETYSFSLVANTLTEFYCISKHDMMGKLTAESLEKIQGRVSKFPDERTVKNAFTLSMGWKQYKADLIESVLANKKSDQKQVGISNEARSRARGLGNKLLATRPPGRSTQTRNQQSMKHPHSRNTVDGRASALNRKSVFERKVNAEDASDALYSRVCNFQTKRSESTQQLLINLKKDTNLEVSMQQHANSTENAESDKQVSEYQKAAQEMQEFLEDGFSLTRHMYDNALSEGARYYCKSIVWV